VALLRIQSVSADNAAVVIGEMVVADASRPNDAATSEKAKLALAEYRKRQNRRTEELKEVYV